MRQPGEHLLLQQNTGCVMSRLSMSCASSASNQLMYNALHDSLIFITMMTSLAAAGAAF